jgi:hypothetical protein
MIAMVTGLAPSIAYATSDICEQIRVAEIRQMQADDLALVQERREQISQIEARLNRAFRVPAAAAKDYLMNLDPQRKHELVQYSLTQDKAELERLDPKTYQGIEDRFRQRAATVRERFKLSSSSCHDKLDRCSSDGTNADNVRRTQHYKRLDTQYYVPGKPSVIACNYDSAHLSAYLSDEELKTLRKVAPDLAEYFASDMGWSNACLRVPFATDADAPIFDASEFFGKVAKKIVMSRWPDKLEARNKRISENAAMYLEKSTQANCYTPSAGVASNLAEKPNVEEPVNAEARNKMEASAGAADADPATTGN